MGRPVRAALFRTRFQTDCCGGTNERSGVLDRSDALGSKRDGNDVATMLDGGCSVDHNTSGFQLDGR
jgi:hypothetical protein